MKLSMMNSVMEKLSDMFPRPVAVSTFLVIAATVFLRGTAPGAEPKEPLVVLAGEQVRWGGPSGKQIEPSEVAEKVSSLLKGKVENQMAEALTVAELAGKVDEIVAAKPGIVVLFLGKSDETAGTKDDTMIATLSAAAKKISANGARVFIVPSISSLGAAVGANLAIAADRSGATFIETGNVIDRRPYDEAMEAVVEAMKEPPRTPVPIKMEAPSAAAKTEVPATPTAGTGPPWETAPSAAAAPTPTAATGETSATPARIAGGEAATIYMPPPPPLKQFDPKNRPVSKKRAPKKPAIAN